MYIYLGLTLVLVSGGTLVFVCCGTLIFIVCLALVFICSVTFLLICGFTLLLIGGLTLGSIVLGLCTRSSIQGCSSYKEETKLKKESLFLLRLVGFDFC